MTEDMINHPPHYTRHPSGVECITITRHMGFNLGNAVKYIWRCDLKGGSIEDLEKAAWYIADEIAKRKSANALPNEGLPIAAHIAKRDADRALDTDPQPLEWPAAPAIALPDGLGEVSDTHAAESAEGRSTALVCGWCSKAAGINFEGSIFCLSREEYLHPSDTCDDWQPRNDLASLAAREATSWQGQDGGVE